MIHFTPIQRLGHSKSAYCLADQLKPNLNFRRDDGTEASLEDVATIGEAPAAGKQFLKNVKYYSQVDER